MGNRISGILGLEMGNSRYFNRKPCDSKWTTDDFHKKQFGIGPKQGDRVFLCVKAEYKCVLQLGIFLVGCWNWYLAAVRSVEATEKQEQTCNCPKQCFYMDCSLSISVVSFGAESFGTTLDVYMQDSVCDGICADLQCGQIMQ